AKEAPKSIVQMLNDALGPGVPKAFPADASPGSRISGWRLMSQLLDSGQWQIADDCPKLIECIPTLMRDPKNTEDVLKVDFDEKGVGDDPADSVRMGLQFMLGRAKKPAEEVIRERALAITDPTERFFFSYKKNKELEQSRMPVREHVVPSWQQRMND